MFVTTRLRRLVAFCTFVLIVSPALMARSEDGESDVGAKVAVLLDLSGSQRSLGQPAMNGFLLACQEAPLEERRRLYATFVDTKTEEASSVAAARAVAPSLTIATGFTNNASLLAAGPVFQQRAIPFLSIGATDPALPRIVGNSVFLTCFGISFAKSEQVPRKTVWIVRVSNGTRSLAARLLPTEVPEPVVNE